MTKFWPRSRDSFSATMRATRSTPPPGACGAMIFTGRLGYGACARAGAASTESRRSRNARRIGVRGCRVLRRWEQIHAVRDDAVGSELDQPLRRPFVVDRVAQAPKA